MPTRSIIGLASGSAAVGVDAALLEIAGAGLDMRVRQILALHQPYARDLRMLIRQLSAEPVTSASSRQGTPPPGGGHHALRQGGLLHRLLGETFAAAARQVADRASLSLLKVQCIGCPGQTVWHEPEGRFPSTMTLGMPAVVAERTGVTTLSDFRARDLAAGGQGVPLAALADDLLFRHPEEDRILVHLGGLARVVWLPPGSGGLRRALHEVIGFEAGPCSLLLDGLIQHVTRGREEYDPGGKHAVQGRCLETLLDQWLAHPYLQRRPPKGLPRHGLTDVFLAQAAQAVRQEPCSLNDLLCTATHFVARVVVGALRRFLPAALGPRHIYLSGGGVRNGLLWHLLEQQLAGTRLARTDALGIAPEARKAASFGVLAALTVDGVPANLPSATGATGSRLLGSLTPGSSSNWARCLAWMAAQTAALAVADAA
jgi:anhydro-N-acetylmuramic acid kinase